MLHPTAQEMRSYCSSMSPCPTSSEAEDVFLAGICTQSTHIRHIYTYIRGCPRTGHRQSTRTHTNCTNSLILLPSLADQDGGLLVRIYIHICKRWIPAATGLAQSSQRLGEATHTRSHSQSRPLQTRSPPWLSRPLHLLTGSIFAGDHPLTCAPALAAVTAPWTHGPSDPRSGSSCCTQTLTHTHAQNRNAQEAERHLVRR